MPLNLVPRPTRWPSVALGVKTTPIVSMRGGSQPGEALDPGAPGPLGWHLARAEGPRGGPDLQQPDRRHRGGARRRSLRRRARQLQPEDLGREGRKRTPAGQSAPAHGNKEQAKPLPGGSDDGYTAVIAVLFTEDLRVEQALRIPREVVNELFERRAHVNGRIIQVGRRLLEHPAVEAIELSDAALDA